MNATNSSTLRQSLVALGVSGCCAAVVLLGGCHKAPAEPKATTEAAAADKPAADAKAGAKPDAADEKAGGKADAADAKPDAADAKPDAGDKADAADKGADKGGKADAADAADAGDGVTLKPEELEKLGVQTTDAVAAKHAPEVAGFGVVIAHDTVAQAVADLASAIAVAKQSETALQRGRRLAGTPGANTADIQETAERQAVVDKAALDLARRKLSSQFGQNAPWKGKDSSPELAAVASGELKLVRVTFPLGTIGDANPSSVRLGHISYGIGGKSWKSSAMWAAPADITVPGKSYFALLKNSDAGEGERLLAWAPVGEAEDGFIVPASATVIAQGKYWFYIEEKPGTFVRTELDTSSAAGDGYFMKEGVSAGDKIVTAAAGQLLARELNPSKEAE